MFTLDEEEAECIILFHANLELKMDKRYKYLNIKQEHLIKYILKGV